MQRFTPFTSPGTGRWRTHLTFEALNVRKTVPVTSAQTRRRPKAKSGATPIALPRVAVYTRLSRSSETSVSVSKQRAACEARAKERTGSMQYDPRSWRQGGDYYEDNDKSAYQSSVVRPSFDALLERMEEYRGGVVIFYALDRLVRRTRQWLDFYEAAEKHEVNLISTTQAIDTTTPHGRVFAAVLVQFAQLESDTIASRVRSAQEVIVRSGRFRGGTPNFGYTTALRENHGWILALEPREADTLRKAADLILDGATLTEAAAALNRAGHTNRKGGPIRGPNLSKWLRNPATGGDSIWRSDVARDAEGDRTTWIEEPVLESARWRRVVATLDANHPAGRGSGRQTNDILLTGLVRCGLCGSRMNGSGSAKGTYGCYAAGDGSGTCRYNTISRQGLEAYVTAWALERLSPEAIAAGEKERRKGDTESKRAIQLRREIEETTEALNRLEDDRGAGIYDAPRSLARYRQRYGKTSERLARLENEIAAVELRQARMTALVAEPLTLAEWDALNIDQRRTTLRAIIDHVSVGPSAKGRRSGPKFDAGRVTIAPAQD